jgi:Ca2+-binding EF-hand superfamily protein
MSEKGLRRRSSRLDQIEDTFHRLDSDGSGFLSREEVVAGLHERGLPATAKTISEFFASADGDADGKITIAEFRAFALSRVADMRATYTAADLNRDGRLTTDELRRAAMALGFSVNAEQLRKLKGQSASGGVITFDEVREQLPLRRTPSRAKPPAMA